MLKVDSFKNSNLYIFLQDCEENIYLTNQKTMILKYTFDDDKFVMTLDETEFFRGVFMKL